MKIFNGRIPLLGAVILASALLGACSSGGSDTAINNNQSTASAVKVTASLGKFENAVVELRKLDNSLIASGAVAADGTTNITLPLGYTGPIVVEVLGGSSVTFYDEAKNAQVSFPAGKKLRAVMPSVKTAVGVTPLTNAAVAKLEAAPGALAAATMDTIGLANTKMAAAFGLSDILLPPNPVSSTTGATLNIALLEDKYALVLAALAKTATTGSDASTVADALALDMKDDKLDGFDGTSTTPSTTLSGYTPANIAAEYQAAATTFMDTTSQAIVVANPIVIVADVSTIIPATPDVNLAKAMFAEMRTTLSSLNNATKTGFLDTKTTSMNADLAANVGPDMGKVINRIYALGAAAQALKDRNAYTVSNTLGFTTVYSVDMTTGAPALGRSKGSVDIAMRFGGELTYCWSSPSAVIPLSTMSCIAAGRGSAVFTSGTAGYLRVVQLDITQTAAKTYSYTATRKNMPVVYDSVTFQWIPNGLLTATTLLAGSGNYTGTVDGVGDFLTGTLIGTMPPSTINVSGTAPLTGLDHFNIAVVRIALATPANSSHFTLVGTVSSDNLTVASTTNATFSFDAGTYIDVENTSALDYSGQTIDNLIAGKVIGTYQTAATKFTGVIDLGASVKDLNKASEMVTSIIATGTISDISVGGVGEILTGKAEITTTDYALYDSLLPDSSTNYVKQSVTFTGTVQQPSRPLMKLVVTKAPTSYQNYAETLNYTYGTVSVTGNRNTNDLTPLDYVLSLSNQDGIAVVITSTPTLTTGVATKSTSTGDLATFTSATGMISYQDGFTESLM